jgi:hypothetical protein
LTKGLETIDQAISKYNESTNYDSGKIITIKEAYDKTLPSMLAAYDELGAVLKCHIVLW